MSEFSGRIKSQNKPIFYVHMAIVLFLMFGLRYTPHPEVITDIGWQVVGVFLGVLWGWNFVSINFISMLGLIAIGFTDYTTVGDAMKNGFGNSTALLVFFSCAFVYILQVSGVCEIIADRVMNMKAGQHHPWIKIGLFFFVNQALGAFTSNGAILILFWAIFEDICVQQKIEKGKFTQYMMAGLCFSALAATNTFAFKAGIAAFTGAYTSVSGVELNTLSMTLFFWIINVIMTVLYLLFGRFILRVDVTPFAESKISIAKNSKITPYQRLCMVCMCIFLFLMFVPSFMPASFFLTGWMKALGTSGIAMGMVIFFLAANFEGCPKVKDIFSESALWGVLFLLACVMVVCPAVKDPELGVTTWIESTFSPLFLGHGTVFFVVAIILIPLLLTNFFNNMATGLIFVPLAATLGSQIGVSGGALTACLCFACSMGLFTPAAGQYGAMLFAKPEWLTGNQCRFYGIVCFVITAFVLVLIGYPLAAVML